MLDSVFRTEMMLDSKLTSASDIPSLVGPTGATGVTGAAGAVNSVNGLTGDIVLTTDAGIFPISNDEPSTQDLNGLINAGVYSSGNPIGVGPEHGPLGVDNPPSWTIYVSQVGPYIQQLYISNLALYYRSSPDSGQSWSDWQEIGARGPTGTTGETGATGVTGATSETGATGGRGLLV